MTHHSEYYLVYDKDAFQLWHGYEESESNFHYARFYGFYDTGGPIWVLECSDKHRNSISISDHVAYRMMNGSRR